MDKPVNGLEILQYLHASGVPITKELCDFIPESVLSVQQGISDKVVFLVDTLTEDKKGELSNFFSDFYNRYPLKTTPEQRPELIRSFRKFVQQVVLRETHKTRHKNPHKIHQPDALAEEIESGMREIRHKWFTWGAEGGYKEMFPLIKNLLTLLQKKYQNPILESGSLLLEQGIITDILPDKYLEFLYDMAITLSQIFNLKLGTIQSTQYLSDDNADVLNDLHFIAVFLFDDLGWDVFDAQIRGITKQIIQNINGISLWLDEIEQQDAHNAPDSPEKGE